MIRSQ